MLAQNSLGVFTLPSLCRRQYKRAVVTSTWKTIITQPGMYNLFLFAALKIKHAGQAIKGKGNYERDDDEPGCR